MSAQVIGNVKSPKGNTFQVWWDSYSKDVYVGTQGTFTSSNTHIGKASSASEAMTKAEASVYNK